MPMTTQDLMRNTPVPDQERMHHIRDRALLLASGDQTSLHPSERMLIDLWRGYSEVVRLFTFQFGWDPLV